MSRRDRSIIFILVLVLLLTPTIALGAPAEQVRYYVVQRGDTLSGIAVRMGVSTAALAKANGIANVNLVYAGQRLTIPGRASAPAGNTAPPATKAAAYYIVQRGDTLARIAGRNGTSVRALMTLNGILNADRIYAGQRLKISGSAAAPRAVTPAKPSTGSASAGKWIDVNLSQQRLTAYEGETPVLSVLISGGTSAHPTVVGRYKVRTKITSQAMSGPGYYLPNVPYVMYFYAAYAIHGTYWHNNFGHPMSHGCVNLTIPDAAWMFNWAPIGTTVVTHW